MLLESNRIYQHEEHGQVVVIGIHEIYNEVDTDSGHGSKVETAVRFASAWDHYGPMPGGGGGEPLDEFEAKATGPIQADPPEFVENDSSETESTGE